MIFTNSCSPITPWGASWVRNLCGLGSFVNRFCEKEVGVGGKEGGETNVKRNVP